MPFAKPFFFANTPKLRGYCCCLGQRPKPFGRRSGLLASFGLLLAWVFTVVAHAENTTPTYPQAIHEKIVDLLEMSGSSNQPLPQNIVESLGDLIQQLDSVNISLNGDYTQVPNHLAKLKQISKDLSSFSTSTADHAVSVEDIRLHLDRRIVLYRLTYEFLSEPQSSTLYKKTDYDRICTKTDALELFFERLQDPAVEYWNAFLALPTLSQRLRLDRDRIGNLKANEPLTQEQTSGICEDANLILNRFTLPLTREQESFLTSPAIAQWKQELEKWRGDTVHPLEFLAVMEEYELGRFLSESEKLSDVSKRLCFCRNDKLRRLGRASETIYGGPNVKLFVSEVLINHFLPARDPEFDRVQDVVVGRRVVGFRRTDTLVKLALSPDPERLNMSLRITGKVSATGHSQVKKTKLTSETYATFQGEKPLEWTEQGLHAGSSSVAVNNRTYLRSVKTGLDGLPLLGDLVKEIARNQFASQEGQITAETQMKIAGTVSSRIDEEVDQRLRQFNANFHKNVVGPMERAGLSFEKKNASTTKDWLLSSWILLSDSSLGSHTQEPDTIQGAFADFKIHETAVQTMIQGLDLAGKTMTVGELRVYIAEKIGRPQFAEKPCDNDDVILCFAAQDPVIVRFQDGRIEITLTMAAMKVNRSIWKNFRFIVNYRPDFDADGNLCLVQDQGHVIGSLNARTQLSLRTVFTKIFPPNRAIPLVPSIFETDERFVQLTTGLCRLERGWLALALVEKK